MKVFDFLANHPVFRHEEFATFLQVEGSRSKKTREALLAYHVSAGHLMRITRGLYATVPRGIAPENCPVDPYLVAVHLTEDAVLAYHSSLQFHGKAYSVQRQFPYLTHHRRRRLNFRDQEFVAVAFPQSLRTKDATATFGIEEHQHVGSIVRVASLERTLVDVLARPDLGGGWEEVWRSLESVEFFHLDQVVEYALMRKNATTVARVGFFLEQHREALMVEEQHLSRLRRHIPRQACYLERQRKRPGKLVSSWNLIVPTAILAREWEESI